MYRYILYLDLLYFINVTYLCKHVLSRSMCSDLYCVDLGLDEIIQHMRLTINMTVAKGF